jgi:5-hydroxyisourate hydrolase
MKSPITTHVLDTALGKPASGVRATLEIQSGLNQWKELGSSMTNEDGRAADLLSPNFKLERGLYRMTFDTASYFRQSGVNGFYPFVQIVFEIRDPATHYHVPLLLSPYGYSTYRGS